VEITFVRYRSHIIDAEWRFHSFKGHVLIENPVRMYVPDDIAIITTHSKCVERTFFKKMIMIIYLQYYFLYNFIATRLNRLK